MIRDERTEIRSILTIIIREKTIGISKNPEVHIFSPTKLKTNASPTLRYLKKPIIPEMAK